MRKVFIFDVDGTLTPSRLSMTKEFKIFFYKWSEENDFYLVSGSDLNKLKEQVPEGILVRAKGIFTCAGNKLHRVKHIPFEHPDGLTRHGLPVLDAEVWEFPIEYENQFEPPEDLMKFLKEKLRTIDYPVKAGNHIENRGALLNFSIVGRDCNQVQRDDYFRYDQYHNERKNIADEIKTKFPGIDASIGGQISIDIYEVGSDKSQVISYIKNPNNADKKYDRYIFLGDRIMEGGNDYPLAKIMKTMDDCESYSVDGYEETQIKLEELND